VKNKEEYKKVE
jgi:hypothetical protein